MDIAGKVSKIQREFERAEKLWEPRKKTKARAMPTRAPTRIPQKDSGREQDPQGRVGRQHADRIGGRQRSPARALTASAKSIVPLHRSRGATLIERQKRVPPSQCPALRAARVGSKALTNRNRTFPPIGANSSRQSSGNARKRDRTNTTQQPRTGNPCTKGTSPLAIKNRQAFGVGRLRQYTDCRAWTSWLPDPARRWPISLAATAGCSR